MAKTRSGQVEEDQQYDYHGVATLAERLRRLRAAGKDTEKLADYLLTFAEAQQQFLAEANQTTTINVDELIASVKSFLFPKTQYHKTKKSSFTVETLKLYRQALICAERAVALRKGGVFGIGAKEAEYQAIKNTLHTLGRFVQKNIENTPWHVPVSKERYLLVALHDSPEAFTDAVKDQALARCIDELNAAKRAFNTEKLTADKSNLPDQISRYVVEVDRQHTAFKALSSACAQRIDEIETKRRSRSKFINFFVDLFTKEKSNLAAEKARAVVLGQVAADYQRIDKRTAALRAVGELNQLQRKLLTQPALISDEELTQLRKLCVTLQADKQFAGHATEFLRVLKRESFSALNQLNDEKSVQRLSAILRLLNEENVRDIAPLNDIRVAVSTTVLQKLDSVTDEAQGLKYIEAFFQVDTKIIKAFDASLFDVIETKKKQFTSLQLLKYGWDRLLAAEAKVALTQAEVNELITAVLWLDKPLNTFSGGIVDALKLLSGKRVEQFAANVKAKLSALQAVVVHDIANLGSIELSAVSSTAIKQRLLFATSANARYTSELAELRKKMLAAIKDKVAACGDVASFEKFITAFNSVLPVELQNDDEINSLFIAKKKEFVKAHFCEEQKKLHAEYEVELRFLQTGDLSLWDSIKQKVKLHDKTAMTEENLQYWRQGFLTTYTERLLSRARVDVMYARIDLAGSASQAAIYEDYLKTLIAEDYQAIAKPLIINFRALTDLRRQAALSKLDQIFGLPVDKPVDMKEFMFRYLALAEFQHFYHDDKTLAQAGREFVHEFQQTAQHDPAFVSEIVAKLPYDALDKMFLTWGSNPDVKIESHDNVFGLQGDIVGVVADDQDSHIQMPRYLLLNMVLELIVADFDALIRGQTVDIKLLNDRIAFAIPKLSRQVREENELSAGSESFRQELYQQIGAITPTTLKDKYHQSIGKQVGTVANFNRYGVLGNVAECESVMLANIRQQFKVQMETFDGLQQADFDSSNEAGAIVTIDEAIANLAKQRLLQPGKAAVVDETVRSLQAQREQYQRAIESKRAKLIWFKEWETSLPTLRKLLSDRQTGLRDFTAAINEKLFNLLEPATADFCRTVRANTSLLQLYETEEIFRERCANLKRDLADNKNIVGVIRSIPETITRHFPEKTADLIRQMQYRFADRFKRLMVSVLDANHLQYVDEVEKEIVQVPVVKKDQRGLLLKFFKPAEKPQVLRHVTQRVPVRDRLARVFEGIESDLVKQMLLQLSDVAARDRISIKHLYDYSNQSEPIRINRV